MDINGTLDWNHIQDEVIEMKKILEESGNPDPIENPRYKELRDDILIALNPFTCKEKTFFVDGKPYRAGVTVCETPFAKMIIAKINKENIFTDGMLGDIDDLLLEAYSNIISMIAFYDPDNPENASFETYIVDKCYYAMLDRYKKVHTIEKTFKDKTGKRRTKYITHDSLDRNINEDGQTLGDIYTQNEKKGSDPINELYKPDNESECIHFTDEDFDEVFPKDYFMPEERKLVKILIPEKNSESRDFLHNFGAWVRKNKQENTYLKSDCEYFYDSLIDYICDKGNPVFLERFLNNTGIPLSSELKKLGLERPSHNEYTADYIYSTCLRIKRRRDRLKKLRH